MKQTQPRFWPPAVPYPHFMGAAPLDVWFRLLFRPYTPVPPRYWPRLALALLLSLFLTVLSLPERLLTGLWLRLRRRPGRPGPVIILGYYRSGTTLLQFLLSGDPNVYAPHWGQAFMPQGFCVTWWLLRWFVLPLLPRTRPQDNVSFGPLVPAEDDFALNNWDLVAPLAGRVVVPQALPFYERFHDLKGLSTAERARWEYCQEGFVRKLAVLAGGRRVLLKTPAHTARVGALLDLFRHTTAPKFIYIARHPHKVFRSNVAMLEKLSDICGLQPPLGRQELEDYVLREYVATEEAYQRMRALIPAGDLAEVRLQDLEADPLGTLRRVYEQLGLPCTPALERQAVAYLSSHRDYKPNVHTPWTVEQKERILPALQPLVEIGRHDEPPPAKVPLPAPDPALTSRPVLRPLALGTVAAVLAVAGWLLLMTWLAEHAVGFIWPCGVAIGVAVLRGACERGSSRLGVCAALLTALAAAAGIVLSQVLLPGEAPPLKLLLSYGAFWFALSLVSAYRIGSQEF